MEETEKSFDQELRVVDANPTLRGAVYHFSGMGCFGVLMSYLLYLGFLWLADTFGEKFAWLAKISSFLLLLLCLFLFLGVVLTLRDSFNQIRYARKLRKNAVKEKGVIVGREKVDRLEDDVYYSFYQFRPDFVMRFHDGTNNLQFYKLPIGSEVTVCYLMEKPEVNTLVV